MMAHHFIRHLLGRFLYLHFGDLCLAIGFVFFFTVESYTVWLDVVRGTITSIFGHFLLPVTFGPVFGLILVVDDMKERSNVVIVEEVFSSQNTVFCFTCILDVLVVRLVFVVNMVLTGFDIDTTTTLDLLIVHAGNVGDYFRKVTQISILCNGTAFRLTKYNAVLGVTDSNLRSKIFARGFSIDFKLKFSVLV